MSTVHTGLEAFLHKKISAVRRARVGLLCHQASVDSQLRHAIDLLSARTVNLTPFFGPEHGLWGTAQDQIEVSSEAKTPIPIFSLYGDQRYPQKEWLQSIDVLICDLQDVGSRYYTFVWTMALTLQACAKYGKKMIILDRPN